MDKVKMWTKKLFVIILIAGLLLPGIQPQLLYADESVTAEGISVVPNENKVYKKGDKFVPDFELYLMMSDGTKVLVEDGPSVAECSTPDMKQVGKQTITVTYQGMQTTYEINVLKMEKLRVVPSVTTYVLGQLFDENNQVYYTLSDGSEHLITGRVYYSGYNRNVLGTQTIVVRYGGLATSYKITVVEELPKDDEEEEIPPHRKIGTITLSQDTYEYTGGNIQPTITIKNKLGQVVEKRYYSVLYMNNRNIGTAKLVFTFIGTYSDNERMTKTFTIVPEGTRITGIKAGSKKLTVKIKAQKIQTNGYQIRYSLKKNMQGAKTKTIKNNRKLSVTIPKLKAKKKYYVQVRTYKTVSGKKYYSSWSKISSKKTK